MGFRTLGQDRVAVAFFGEGSTSRGDFHEALNFAGIHKLPVVFICENNQYAFTTPVRLQMPVETVAERADAYAHAARPHQRERSLPRAGGGRGGGHIARGTARARRSIDCVTYRIKGHSEHDPARYREAEEVVEWGARDPIELYELYLEKRGYDLGRLGAEVRAEVADDRSTARSSSRRRVPIPIRRRRAPRSSSAAGRGHHGDRSVVGGAVRRGRSGRPQSAETGGDDADSDGDEVEVTYLTAINRTLAWEMEHDPRVILPRRGHRHRRRRVRRDRGAARPVRRGAGDRHADLRVADHRRKRRRLARRAPARWPRCSSPTSSPAASIRS